MNLSDFEKTNHSGLYISKASHPTFGKKYIARFQYERKRYVKVLGYTRKDNLTKKSALDLMQKFKDSIVIKEEIIEAKTKKIVPETTEYIGNEQLSKLIKENEELLSILGDYKKLDIDVFIKKISN